MEHHRLALHTIEEIPGHVKDHSNPHPKPKVQRLIMLRKYVCDNCDCHHDLAQIITVFRGALPLSYSHPVGFPRDPKLCRPLISRLALLRYAFTTSLRCRK